MRDPLGGTVSRVAMHRKHKAVVTWSASQLHKGLPEISELTDPAWMTTPQAPDSEGWSVTCEFSSSPCEQGNPSQALVAFLVDDAPHDLLVPGAVLRLFERDTADFAQVEILD